MSGDMARGKGDENNGEKGLGKNAKEEEEKVAIKRAHLGDPVLSDTDSNPSTLVESTGKTEGAGEGLAAVGKGASSSSSSSSGRIFVFQDGTFQAR